MLQISMKNKTFNEFMFFIYIHSLVQVANVQWFNVSFSEQARDQCRINLPEIGDNKAAPAHLTNVLFMNEFLLWIFEENLRICLFLNQYLILFHSVSLARYRVTGNGIYHDVFYLDPPNKIKKQVWWAFKKQCEDALHMFGFMLWRLT